MKNLQSLFLLFFCIFIFNNAYPQSRTEKLFNYNWKFHKGDIEHAQSISFVDTQWRSLNLPHDWSIEGPFDRKWASSTAYLPGGVGWYRKTFFVPENEKGKKLSILFNGIYKDSKVWINGHFLGERPNGFIAFYYDLTPYINFGDNNVIAVRVNHKKFADSRWYTGSGIYRNVYLITTDKLHIGQWGVSVNSESVDQQSALVNIKIALKNEYDEPRTLDIINIIKNNKGDVVGRDSSEINILGHQEDTLQSNIEIEHPALWSVSAPTLYKVNTLVKVSSKVLDEEMTSFGIRSFRFDPNKGFFLNGVNMKLKGVCVHDDAGCLGVAVPADVWKRRLKILKEAGCNAIRMSHNPHAPELYDLCDEMGFLVIDEAFDEWELGKHKWIEGWNVGTPGTDGYHTYFKEWADRDLRDMIRRDRNHPSVIMWSIGNEIDYPNDPYSDPVLNFGKNPQIYGSGYMPNQPSAKNLGRIANKLTQVVKRYDTTRPVTAGLAAVVVSDKVCYAQTLDVAGYNYQEYRYPGDHKTFPDRKIYGSENGMSYNDWLAVEEHDYIAGQFLWTGIDYLGEAGKWPSRGNNAGLLNMAGFKKSEYFFRQSIWAKKTMVYIGTTKLRPHNGKLSIWAHKRADPVWNYEVGDTVLVNCFTNCDEAELFLNGQSLGRKRQNDSTHIIAWRVPYAQGILSVKGYNQGEKKATDQIQTYNKPDHLKVSTDKERLKADGRSVAHLSISIVDKNGVEVYDAGNEISCNIVGPGKLLGLESGDNNSHESYTVNHRRAYHGKLIAYIQSFKKGGKIKVAVSSPGLGKQVVNLVSVN